MAEDLVRPRQLSGRSIGTSLVLLIHLAATMTTDALWFSVPDSGTKCVAEEIHSNNVVIGDYTVIYGDREYRNPTVSVKVTSPYGDTLHHQENVTTGHFAFTTKESGSYLSCFWLDGHHQNVNASVNLEMRIGIGAKDWDTVAKREKLEGVELELRKLQTLVEFIHLNLLHLKSKEAEMREVSERTNTRVACYSIMALGVCILVSALQLWHLKGFFEKNMLVKFTF